MRILLTRLSSLGDVVHTWPLVDALAHHSPRPHLAWLVEEEYAPLVAPHPGVEQAIPVATRRWRRRPWSPAVARQLIAAVRALRRARCEIALDPQGLVKSAVWGRLAGVPCRIGLATEVRRERGAGVFYTHLAPAPGQHRHAVDVALSLLASLGMEPPWGAAPDGSFLLATTPPRPRGQPSPVLLVPGSGHPAKCWDSEALVQLARHLAAAGLNVEVLWGEKELHLARAIAAAAAVALAPPTPLPVLPAYLAGTRAVVGGDTGPAHLAAALGVPTVMLHLATDPQRSGARGPRVQLLDGRPGRGTAITPADVATAVLSHLDG